MTQFFSVDVNDISPYAEVSIKQEPQIIRRSVDSEDYEDSNIPIYAEVNKLTKKSEND